MIKLGKTICVFSVKGGIGKTTTVLNLAGIYSTMNLKTLIIDLNLDNGGIAFSLNKKTKKTIYNLLNDMDNKKYTNISDYVSNYNYNIDIVASPNNLVEKFKINNKYINLLLYDIKNKYDVILIDTSSALSELNLMLLDKSDKVLFMVSNDPVCLNSSRKIISIFKENEIDNYKILYNASRDTSLSHFTLFDVKTILKKNVNYTISKNFYIKNIDSYIMDGKIITLNRKIQSSKKKDYKNISNMATDLLK